jgi:hypothetical protein
VAKLLGFIPIEKAITNGVLPFVLSSVANEENAMMLYQELTLSLIHIKAELKTRKASKAL